MDLAPPAAFREVGRLTKRLEGQETLPPELSNYSLIVSAAFPGDGHLVLPSTDAKKED